MIEAEIGVICSEGGGGAVSQGIQGAPRPRKRPGSRSSSGASRGSAAL